MIWQSNTNRSVILLKEKQEEEKNLNYKFIFWLCNMLVLFAKVIGLLVLLHSLVFTSSSTVTLCTV